MVQPQLFAFDENKPLNDWALFHVLNPHVFELFKRFANEARKRGKRAGAIGAGFIWERMRWYCYFEIDRRSDKHDYRLNNYHRAFYARWLIANDSRFRPLIEIRRGTHHATPAECATAVATARRVLGRGPAS